MDKIAADEAAASGDEQVLHDSSDSSETGLGLIWHLEKMDLYAKKRFIVIVGR